MANPASDDDDWWSSALALLDAPSGGRAGPTRTRAAAWQLTWNELRERGPAAAAEVAGRQGFVLTREQARVSGVHDADSRRQVRRGEWTAPRRGILCPLPGRTDDRPHGRSREIAATAAALSRPGCAISHESAALLDGLPVLTPPRRPVLTTPNVSHAGGWPDCLVHAAPTPAAELATWFGAPVTSTARTIVDIARSGGAGAGLIVADAALREGLVTRAELLASWQRGWRRPGNTEAARVVVLADGHAESPLESLTRLCLLDGDLPTPELQIPIATHRGTYRVDLLFRSRRVVVEADGQLKYRLDPLDGGNALWNEKLRQEALERAGYRVVRVTWDDVVNHPARTVWRVVRALSSPLIFG